MSDVDYDVVVVGAGYAGVTSARDLRDRGRSVLLLEGSDRLGGRTFVRPFAGRPDVMIECGGEFVGLEAHVDVRREVERYDVPLHFSGPVNGPEMVRFFTGGELRSMPVPVADLWALEAVAVRMHQAASRLTQSIPLHMQGVSDLDVSAAEFFRPLGLPESVRDLLYALIGANEGADPDEASLLWLLGLIAGSGGSPLQYLMFGVFPSQVFTNGSQDLLERMVSESGMDLRLSSRVVQVADHGSKVLVRTQDNTEVRARACVMAAPTNVLRHITFMPGLPREQADLVAHNHASRAIKVHLIVENVPAAPLCIGGRAPLQVIIPRRQLDNGQWLLVGFGAESVARFDPNDLAAVQDALRYYLPEARVLAVDGHNWGTDPLFDGTYRVDRPGEAKRVGQVMSAMPGRTAFAGGDIEERLSRSTINGAIASGVRAAARVHDFLRAEQT